MTDEEKAEEYLKENRITSSENWEVGGKYCYTLCKQAYLDGHAEGFDEGYKKATERAYERQQDLTDTYVKDGKKIKQLEEENEELNAITQGLKVKIRDIYMFNLSDMTSRDCLSKFIMRTIGDMFDCYGDYINEK